MDNQLEISKTSDSRLMCLELQKSLFKQGNMQIILILHIMKDTLPPAAAKVPRKENNATCTNNKIDHITEEGFTFNDSSNNESNTCSSYKAFKVY